MEQGTTQGLWVAFTVLASAAGGGFGFLLIAVLQSKERINSCVTYKDLNNDFYRKEMIDTHIKNIDKELITVSSRIEQMILKVDKVIMKYLSEKGTPPQP